MDTEQIIIKKFKVSKLWAMEELNKRKSYADAGRYSSFLDELKDKDLADARCLLRLILKEVDQHNSNIKTKMTLLDKMRYKHNWEDSKVFTGMSIPLKKIDGLIGNNPGLECDEILKLLKGVFIETNNY